ncbi:diguanylate cyclase [bacterium]|nr:diguanylate cyclase [bacterium]
MNRLFINNKFTRNIFYLIIAALSVVLLFFIVAKTNTGNFFSEIESKTFDVRQKIIAKYKNVSKDIVIIAIDDASLEYLLEKQGEWPFPRKFYAKIVDYLEEQNPKSIAFDLMFIKSLKNNPKSDKKLADVFKTYDNVFTSINFDSQSEEVREPINLTPYMRIKITNNSNLDLENPNLIFSNCRPILQQILDNTANIGHINVARQHDGIIREVPLFINYKEDFYPHLALKIAMHYLDIDESELIIDKDKNIIFADKKIPLTYLGTSILNWYGESGRNENSKNFKYIPLWQIVQNMENNTPDETLEGKILYIGTSATSLYDIKSVPTERYLPGVELHATLVNNIIDNNFIKKVSLKTDVLMCILLGVIIGYIVITLNSTFFTFLMSVLTGVTYFVFSLFLMKNYNIWIGLVMPLLSMVFVYTITYIIKYILKSRDFEYTYKLATTDGLTNLYNHRFFQEQMLINIENAKRYENPFSLILIDIDFFKKFNDTYGHQAGDAVLRQVAEQIKKSVRSTDIVCRYGGEEMSVILTNTGKDEAIITAQKICDAIASKPFKLSNTLERNVTISLGVSTFPQNGQTPSELIEYADKGLYMAKENGRNQVGKVE